MEALFGDYGPSMTLGPCLKSFHLGLSALDFNSQEAVKNCRNRNSLDSLAAKSVSILKVVTC